MIRMFTIIAVIALIMIQLDHLNEPLVTGYHGLGLAVTLLLAMFVAEVVAQWRSVR